MDVLCLLFQIYEQCSQSPLTAADESTVDITVEPAVIVASKLAPDTSLQYSNITPTFSTSQPVASVSHQGSVVEYHGW